MEICLSFKILLSSIENIIYEYYHKNDKFLAIEFVGEKEEKQHGCT